MHHSRPPPLQTLEEQKISLQATRILKASQNIQSVGIHIESCAGNMVEIDAEMNFEL
jgi:hypothetical protein